MLSPDQVTQRDGKLTADSLRLILSYNEETGLFHWRAARPGVLVGSIAGSIEPDGYRRIRILYRKYHAGPLAWLYVTGEWPSQQVDHKNLDRSDDRFSNLRLATQSQNNANRRVAKSKSYSVKGIYRKKGRWEASIQKDGHYQYLGRFATAEEAQRAYGAAAQEMFGDFARAE